MDKTIILIGMGALGTVGAAIGLYISIKSENHSKNQRINELLSNEVSLIQIQSLKPVYRELCDLLGKGFGPKYNLRQEVNQYLDSIELMLNPVYQTEITAALPNSDLKKDPRESSQTWMETARYRIAGNTANLEACINLNESV